jgi:hypothetical protein
VTSRGRPTSEGVAVEAHEDTKAGAEEREARRSRGGDNEDSAAQPAEGTRGERFSRRIDGKWSVSGLVLALSHFVGSEREERVVSWERE